MQTAVQIGKNLVIMRLHEKNLYDTKVGKYIEMKKEEGLKEKSRKPRRFLHDSQSGAAVSSPRIHF